MGEVTVVIPSDLSRILRVDEKQLPKLVRIYLAVELYREGVVSLGKAAEIAGGHQSRDDGNSGLQGRSFELH
ncbi:UPF0175 family protein [Thermococcus sp. JCM 11816]|uniref:UPF0175 family protein n=1 Tax=Thermococcus sp. (strain JCM 11816 / KS-1) TaxID=1295125 RepID=UPI000A52E15F